MINDERCRRVMKKFRKRRRQRSGLTAVSTRFGQGGVEGFEMLENPRVRRKTTSSIATDENDNDCFLEDKSPSSALRRHQSFGCHSIQPNCRYHRCHSHQNQKHKRRNHINWGESIARRRAFSQVSRTSEHIDSTSYIPSEPELVHRKPESIHTFSFYSSCTFLDSYERVLAVDNKGTLDLIRLADIRSQTQSCMEGKKKTTLSHKKLVTGFELGAELKQQSFATVRVQPLSGGSTVAFGLEDDSLCLLDLEGRTKRAVYGGKRRDEILTPVSFSTGLSSYSSLLFTASRTIHPRRTHYRDRRNPKLSLHELCRHHMNQHNADCLNRNNTLDSNDYKSICDNHSVSELHSIDYTTARERISSPVRFIPGLRPRHDARWDVLEIRPNCSATNSLLYVAHVDSDYDTFWTQVLDGRVRASTAATKAKGNRNRYNATTILVDGTTRDRPGTVEEHVTACTMVTDICMATAHISCGNYGLTPASEFFDRGLPYAGYSGMSSCVKLWDLRMVKNKERMKDDSPVPADTIVFPAPPSFQNANFAILEPFATIQTQLTSTEGALAFSEATFSDESSVDSCAEKGLSLGCSDHVITNLSSASDPYDRPNNNGSARGGSIVVTTQSRTKSTRVEHAKLDLGGTMRMTRRISQTNSNLGCQPIYAIDSSHKYLATCSNVKNSDATGDSEGNICSRLSGASTRLSLYNLIEVPPRNKLTVSNDRYLPTSRLHRQQRVDPSWSYQTDASLTDRYGVETELSCITINSNGTALLGGTTDGDLFVWRGM